MTLSGNNRQNFVGLLLTAITILTLAAPVAHCQGAFADPGDPQHRIAVLSEPSSVPRYGRFEATFQVATQAPNLQLPYDPVEPPYAKNLFPQEDAALGVSADALLLPPGQSDWARAQDQPAFYYEGYDDTGAPTPEHDWHLRFAPDTVGQWQVRFRVADAQGVALSAPQTFTVTPSASHGFVRVSPTDARYFEFSDGTPFLPAGDVDTTGDTGQVQRIADDGAVGLTRVWISGNGGMEAGPGGGGNIANFHGVCFNPDGDAPVQGAGGGRRFALDCRWGFEGDWPGARPGRPYTVTAWVRLQGTPGTHPGASWSLQPLSSPLRLAAPVPDDGGWHRLTLRLPPGTYNPLFVAEMHDAPGGPAGGPAAAPVTCRYWLGDLRVTDDRTGGAVFDLLGMDWLARYGQEAGARLDRLVSLCQSSPVPQYLRLCCLQHEDAEAKQVGPDGSASAPADGNAVGGVDWVGDVFAQRTQRYFARYLMARWGWSPAVMGVEHVNEGDPNSGVYFAGAQSFAAAVHAAASDHRLLASTSGWFAQGQGGYNSQFYEGQYVGGDGRPACPDIDYADIHDYVFQDSTAYNTQRRFYPQGTATVDPAGGPGGTGALTLTPGSDCPFPVVRLRGAGTWTIKFFYRTSPDAVYNSPISNWYTHGGGAVVTSYTPYPYTETPPAPVPAWTEYSQTFTCPADDAPCTVQFIRGLLKSGTESFADVRLYAPSGLFTRLTFDEPALIKDYAAYTRYLPLEEESYGGGLAIGKPLVIGETEPVGDDSHGQSDSTRARLDPTFDPQGDAVRQAAWGGIGSAPAVFQWWNEFAQEADQCDGWRFYAAVQRFLADVPLTNGRYRDAGATVSTPDLISVGQADAQAGRAYLYVYNRAANWDALANHAPITPVTGTLTLPGMADGTYTVQRCDTSTGDVISSETDTASGGLLIIPITALAQDTALKVYPLVVAPAAAPVPVVTNTVVAGTTPAPAGIAINSGGPAVGAFATDGYYSGGVTAHTTAAVSTAGVTGPAPQAVYQTERYGNFTYTLPNLTPGAAYTLRLHFAEIYWTSAGKRLFNVSVNGSPVLTDFDVFAVAGGRNKAAVESLPVTADASGRVVIQFTTLRDNAKVSGIEIVPGAAPSNPPPAAGSLAYQVNAGGGAVGAFATDGYYSGGVTAHTTAAVSTAGVTGPAPQAVYQTERYGNFTYTLPNLTPGAAYTLRLHFAEIYWTSAGKRLFNVSVNGSPVLTDFDVFAVAGGRNKAAVESLPVTADASGRVVIQFTTLRDNAKVSGIEIVPGAAPSNPPPAAGSLAYQVNAGGGAVGAFATDGYYSGGVTAHTTAAVSTAGVTGPAPQAVYQTERYGNFTYTLPNLTPGAAYTLRLHFAEIYWTSAGKRLFNVSVNGSPVLTDFDVFAVAGGRNKAAVESLPVTADASGRVVIQFTTLRDNAKVSGIELTP